MLYLKRLKGSTLNVISEPYITIFNYVEPQIQMFANNIIESLDCGIVDVVQPRTRQHINKLMSSRKDTWSSVKTGWNSMVDYAIPNFGGDPETERKKDDINNTLDDIGDYAEKESKKRIDLANEYAKRWAKCHLDPYISPAIVGGGMFIAEKVTKFAIKSSTSAVKTWVNTRSADVIKRDFDPNAVKKYWRDKGVPENPDDEEPVEELVDRLIEEGYLKNPCPKSATWTTITL